MDSSDSLQDTGEYLPKGSISGSSIMDADEGYTGVDETLRKLLESLCETSVRNESSKNPSSSDFNDNCQTSVESFILNVLHSDPEFSDSELLSRKLREVSNKSDLSNGYTDQVISKFLYFCTTRELCTISKDQVKFFNEDQISILIGHEIPEDCPIHNALMILINRIDYYSNTCHKYLRRFIYLAY